MPDECLHDDDELWWDDDDGCRSCFIAEHDRLLAAEKIRAEDAEAEVARLRASILKALSHHDDTIGAALDGLQQQANPSGFADVRGELLADEGFLVTLVDCDCCLDLIGPCPRSVIEKVLDRVGLQQQEGE